MSMKDTALIIFVDSKGLVLLQQKTYDAPNYPGAWSFFGGTVENGESPKGTAKREAREELALELSDSDLLFFRDFQSSEKSRSVFISHIPDDKKTTLREGRGLGYFTKEEIACLQMPQHIRDILSVYFSSNVVH